MTRTRPLESLRPGQQFVIPATARTGTLLRVGLMGCVIRYDGTTAVATETEFDVPTTPLMIGGSTAVRPLTQEIVK